MARTILTNDDAIYTEHIKVCLSVGVDPKPRAEAIAHYKWMNSDVRKAQHKKACAEHMKFIKKVGRSMSKISKDIGLELDN